MVRLLARLAVWLVNGPLRRRGLEPRVMLGHHLVLLDAETGRVVCGLKNKHPLWKERGS
jgi:hypothetical protein